jgi:hypothetical protein
MAILRFLVAIIVIAAILVGGVTLAARFSDGPMGPFAGGPFTSGDVHAGAEPDWGFVTDVETVELQLLDPDRSRTTWILEHDGRIFIPCGYMDSTWGRLWKQWPIEAERDGRAVLRVDGTLYPRQLVRVHDGVLAGPVLAELTRKYGVAAPPAAVNTGALWLFELAPRDPGTASAM